MKSLDLGIAENVLRVFLTRSGVGSFLCVCALSLWGHWLLHALSQDCIGVISTLDRRLFLSELV